MYTVYTYIAHLTYILITKYNYLPFRILLMLFRHFNISYMYCRHEKNVQDHISPYSQSHMTFMVSVK